ncbi:hypothetical protein, partial [Streptomyces platensis]
QAVTGSVAAAGPFRCAHFVGNGCADIPGRPSSGVDGGRFAVSAAAAIRDSSGKARTIKRMQRQ